jgi:hypothetical protein
LIKRISSEFISFSVATVVCIIIGALFFSQPSFAQESTPQPYPIETVVVEQDAYPNPTAVVVQEAYPIVSTDNFFLEDAADNTTAVLIGAFFLVVIVSAACGVFILRKRRISQDN